MKGGTVGMYHAMLVQSDLDLGRIRFSADFFALRLDSPIFAVYMQL